MFAVIQALVNQTLNQGADIRDAGCTLISRISAMASPIDLLTQSDWQVASLEEVIRNALAHREQFYGRVDITGPAVSILSDPAVRMAPSARRTATPADFSMALP